MAFTHALVILIEQEAFHNGQPFDMADCATVQEDRWRRVAARLGVPAENVSVLKDRRGQPVSRRAIAIALHRFAATLKANGQDGLLVLVGRGGFIAGNRVLFTGAPASAAMAMKYSLWTQALSGCRLVQFQIVRSVPDHGRAVETEEPFAWRQMLVLQHDIQGWPGKPVDPTVVRADSMVEELGAWFDSPQSLRTSPTFSLGRISSLLNPWIEPSQIDGGTDLVWQPGTEVRIAPGRHRTTSSSVSTVFAITSADCREAIGYVRLWVRDGREVELWRWAATPWPREGFRICTINEGGIWTLLRARFPTHDLLTPEVWQAAFPAMEEGTEDDPPRARARCGATSLTGREVSGQWFKLHAQGDAGILYARMTDGRPARWYSTTGARVQVTKGRPLVAEPILESALRAELASREVPELVAD